MGFAALVGQPAPGFATLGANSGGNTEKPPNVIMLMTDDQTVESMRVMPKTNSLLVDRGVEFTNSFASNPVCCPSRATFLTGQYSHNNGVYRNTGSNGGYAALDGSRTLPVWLQRAGYFTAHVGKYLNGYGLLVPTEIPPGWSEWYGSVDLSTYSMHGYTLNQNGTLVTYGEREVEDPDTYQTDVYADKAAELIARRAPRRKPFFLSVAPLAPHSEVHPSGTGVEEFPNPRPAPRHTGAFDSEPLPVTPSSNEADVSDKPAAIRALEPMSPAQVALATTRYSSRLASLLAVDDLVRTVVDAVRATGEVDRTLIVFTSDNGFLQGEHRVPVGKQYLYEESARVPLVIRGPGIPAGERRRQPVANVDLAPTILHYAGAKPKASPSLDGRSLKGLVDERRREPGRAIVLENWCEVIERCYAATTPRYRAVRTLRYLYAEYPNGERELYDLDRDPFELTSLHADPSYEEEREALATLLGELEDCAGRECRAKPKLTLRLNYREGRERGDPCTRSPVKAIVVGADRREALEARFFVGGMKLGKDRARPLAQRLRRRKLRDRAPSQLSAEVTVLDGRLRTIAAWVPRRC